MVHSYEHDNETQFPITNWNIMTGCATISFSIITLLFAHGAIS